MYKSRNRLTAIFNIFICLLILYLMFFNYKFPSLNMLTIGTVLYIGPIILMVLVGVINIYVGITNNPDSYTNKIMFICVGFVGILLSFLTYIEFVTQSKIVQYIFIGVVVTNSIFSLIVLIRNLNLSDKNYEFLDRPSSYTFKIMVIVLIIFAVLPIVTIEVIKSKLNTMALATSDVAPFYLMIYNKDASNIRFINSQGKDVAQMSATATSQLKTTYIDSNTKKLTYCMLYNNDKCQIIDLSTDNPQEVYTFKVNKRFDMNDFDFVYEISTGLFTADYVEETYEEEKAKSNEVDAIVFVQMGSTDEFEEYEDDSEVDEDYRYFSSSSLPNIYIQVAYYPYKQEISKFLSRATYKLQGLEDYYGYYKEYAIINKTDEDDIKYIKLDVENLIYGGRKTQNGVYLDTILVNNDNTIPFISNDKTGIIDIYSGDRTEYDSSVLLLDIGGSARLFANISADNIKYDLYNSDDGNSRITDKSYSSVYILTDSYVVYDGSNYSIYLKNGNKLSDRTYSQLYTLGGNIIAAGYEQNGSIVYDLFDSTGLLNETPEKTLDVSQLDSIKNYVYNGVYRDYIGS